MQHYPMAIILPPKIYYYEPKIFGFKMAGKRGSKTFAPPTGNTKYIEDSMQSLELEALLEKEKDKKVAVVEGEKRPATKRQGKKNNKK